MPLGESMKSTLKVIRLLRLINQGDLERYLEVSNGNKKVFTFPNATPEDLQLIRQKLKKVNQML